MSNNSTTPNYIELAADIVSAFVSNNSVRTSELPSLIGSVHAAIQNIGQPTAKQEETKPVPAVSIKKSVTPDFLISLEDGKQYKSLKRHLGKLGLTPEAYREKWGLSRDYPMVAPAYAARRSELARSMGLGQKRSKAGQAKAATSDALTSTPAKTPAKRGRKKPAA